MVQTRSASSSPVKKQQPTPAQSSISTATKPQKPATQPLRLVIAPKNLSANARFLDLANPVDGKPQKYLFCIHRGLLELKRVEAPKHDPRSTLFAAHENSSRAIRIENSISSGYVNKIAAYSTATPLDICFILLPLVTATGKGNLFQSLDDIIDTTELGIYDLGYILRHTRDLVEKGLESICDTIEAGDEKLYRYSQTKTLQLIVAKARRAAEKGLPASLEERFVTRALEAPVLSIRREDSTISACMTEPEAEPTSRTATPAASESFDSQSSAASVAPSVVFSEASITTTTTTTTIPESTVPESITRLQRIWIAFRFILASYTPKPTATVMEVSLVDTSRSGINILPLLEEHGRLTVLRARAELSATLTANSRKRGSLEDEEDAEVRAEKKRKLEEEEKRKKASISHGVKALAKVDVKGMKKMSSFFTPKAKAKG